MMANQLTGIFRRLPAWTAPCCRWKMAAEVESPLSRTFLKRHFTSMKPPTSSRPGPRSTPWNTSHDMNERHRVVLRYTIAGATFFLAISFASVPLYRIYCQQTGKGGKPARLEEAVMKVANMDANKERIITVNFSADRSSMMAWEFKPTQQNLKVYPGETALAFYTARNPLSVPMTGISTYSVMPYEAAQYLHKIQCFCFEEQMLNPGEEVDMPVFFYIDPEYVEDPRLEHIDDIVLSYTFFQARENFSIPMVSPHGKTAQRPATTTSPTQSVAPV